MNFLFFNTILISSILSLISCYSVNKFTMTTAHRSTIIPSQNSSSSNIFTDFYIKKSLSRKDKIINKRLIYKKLKYHVINTKNIRTFQGHIAVDSAFKFEQVYVK